MKVFACAKTQFDVVEKFGEDGDSSAESRTEEEEEEEEDEFPSSPARSAAKRRAASMHMLDEDAGSRQMVMPPAMSTLWLHCLGLHECHTITQAHAYFCRVLKLVVVKPS